MKQLIVLFFLTQLLPQQLKPLPTLFQVVHDGRWGYINSEGTVVIPYQFQSAQPFSEDLAAVRQGGQYGYIDTVGRWVIPPQFDYASPFKEGMAIAHHDATPFYIDTKGQKTFSVTDAIELGNFERGLAIVRTKTGVGILKKSGQWLLPPRYNYIARYTDHWFKISNTFKEGKREKETEGVLDASGKWIAPLGIYSSIGNFSGNYARVDMITKDKHWGTSGWIDTTGQLVFSKKDDEKFFGIEYNTAVHDSVFIVSLINKPPNSEKGVQWRSDWKYNGLMNLKGQLLIDNVNIKTLRYLGNGYYKAENKEDSTWVVNTKGQSIDLPQDSIKKLKDITKEESPFERSMRTQMTDFNNAYEHAVGNMVLPPNQSIQADTLDIDFMNRGYFYASSASKANDSRYGGWGGSDNEASAVEKLNVPKKGLTIIAQTQDSVHVYGHYVGFKVFVVNNSTDTFLFDAQDSRLYMTMQAKDKTGQWRDVEYLPSSWCGNSYHTLALDPQHYWSFSAPLYKGSLQTTMRFKLLHKTQKEEQKKRRHQKSLELYSNEFRASANPAQFWRKESYTPQGIMDPYDE